MSITLDSEDSSPLLLEDGLTELEVEGDGSFDGYGLFRHHSDEIIGPSYGILMQEAE